MHSIAATKEDIEELAKQTLFPLRLDCMEEFR